MNAPTSKAAISADELGQQIEALRADFMKLANTLSSDVSEGIERAGQKVGQTGRDARESATDAVLRHPLTAVGLAAVLGLLLGMILRRS